MTRIRYFLFAAVAAFLTCSPSPVAAQTIIVASCGTPAATMAAGQAGRPLTMDVNGVLCTNTGSVQSGTWTVQPGNTANTTPWLFTLPSAGTSIVGTTAAGTAGATSALTGSVYNSTIPTLTNGQQVARQADTTGAIRVSSEGGKATYSASAVFAPASSATDIFTITGSASKTVRVTRAQISGTATSAAANVILLVKRAAANSGGTSAAPAKVPHDSANAAASATVLNYTANPTVNNFVGNIRQQSLTLTTTAGATPSVPAVFDFTTRNSQGVVVRGTSEVVAINFNSASISGASVAVDMEWTEE